MATDDPGSVSRLVADLRAGDAGAAQPLWERYFARLVGLARARLRAGARGADADEEDAALSAFESFCTGAARGQFPELGDREDLWKLLVVITVRKVGAQVERRRAQKRGGGWTGLAGHDGCDPLAEVIDSEPTPEFAALVAEQYCRLLGLLPDEGLRQVALRRMEGYTSDEIAAELGCARRTVARRLDLIRRLWTESRED